MMRRIMKSDNSCLFNAVAYLTERSLESAEELRAIIASYVISDPDTYNEVYLGKPNQEYSEWIMNPTSWGGAIELQILSDYFKIEIGAVNIQTLRVDRFGEANNYSNRVFVIYDGIHYDSLVRNTSSDGKYPLLISNKQNG